MTNNERRSALNKARAQAIRHATWAEELSDTRENDPKTWSWHIRMAGMWSQVAQALKDGDPVHDGPDNIPASQFSIPDTITR